MTEKQVFKTTWGGRPLEVEVGQLAKQANGAVLVRYGDTVVLSAAVASKEAKDTDFFPLTINYEEKMYAVGKVPGGFIKREGRPSTEATLTARLIDRPIRPMFAEGFRNEVQVTNIVMSVEQDCTPAMAAMLGSSLALSISDIPFDGPIAGVDVGRVNGEYVLNPTVEQAEQTDIELTVAGTKKAINMVESGAKEVSEEDMLGALLFGFDAIKELVAFQEEVVAAVGKPKMEVKLLQVDADLKKEIFDGYYQTMKTAVMTEEKLAREDEIDKVKDTVKEVYAEKFAGHEEEAQFLKEVKQIAEDLEKDVVRELITIDKIRPDGRQLDEIRPLASEVGLLPRVHGSGLFTRGQTQALSACTLAPLGEHQIIDGLGVEESKRFIHHYNFPQFSVGSTGRAGSPGRREIGHGALAERALIPVLPTPEEFPYAIRAVSETFESNGSTSMASTCASCMSLMAAGVPIKKMVAGISCGLVTGDTDDDYIVLTDIQGLEDFFGDMDFKVTGTTEGITAIQMDIKIHGLTRPIVEEAIARTREARLFIMDTCMKPAIAEPRKTVGEYAPKIIQTKIDPAKIGEVVGQRGKVINAIIDECGVKIDITDDGFVSVCGVEQAGMDQAMKYINTIVQDFEEGQIYEGKVVSIKEFGAFVEFAPGKEGMVHISKIAKERIEHVEDVLTLGDKVRCKCMGKDKMGRLSFSIKDAE